VGRREWREGAPNGHPDAAVQPRELCRNDCFRRQGVGGEAGGDFYALKELVTAFSEYHPQRGHYAPVRDTLIRAHQYFIARYDVDGFRIDTLKYIEPEFARIFANAIREMALGIGKKNFFTFGEVYDEEEQIARFVGRSAHETGDAIGVDAALDFPLFYRLPGVVKGFQPPGEVAAVFERRKQVQRGLLSTHGDASKFFVTFLDNHDQHARCYFRDPAAPHRFDDQLTLGVALLFALQGIPCLYYGTEQGLAGTRERYTPGAHLCPEAVREALWGRNAPDSFDTTHPFYRAVQGLSQLRRLEPALRYGRQYFRALSGNGRDFGISWTPRGVLAVSRVLNDREVLAVANTNADQSWSGEVIVDFALNPTGATYAVLFSNRDESHRASPGPVAEKPAGGVAIHEVDGAVTNGPARALPVTLAPLEIQILRKED
jgi:glycosidase